MYAPPGELFPHESASEAVGDHHDHAKFMATRRQLDSNLGDSSMVVSWSPFPLKSAFVCEVLPPLSLGSCRFECFMFAGHEAVIHIEICAVSE